MAACAGVIGTGGAHQGLPVRPRTTRRNPSRTTKRSSGARIQPKYGSRKRPSTTTTASPLASGRALHRNGPRTS
ncbi:MAG: hypothetical protein K1X95_08090 [Acidimicrobiia bacterium]|nr:hypothetical protein [Acidimicrobiia bacterium]